MPDTFQLRIVTPTRLLLDERVREITAPGTLGEFGVFPDHITFLTSLEIGSLHFRTDGDPQRIAIRGGFAEVADNVITVLADDAAFPQDIDAERARGELAAADSRLRDLSPLDPSYTQVDADRRWAQTCLEVSGVR
ncbi:MAG: ATP synthase F1 subunit epsilon [Candidatus Binatia bacterium]